MLTLLNILTFAWLIFWALRAFRLIAAGARQSILIALLIHFVFSGIPLLFDVLFGQPSYPNNPGFYLASSDTLTSVIYCLYVSLIPVLWWWWSSGQREQRRTSRVDSSGISVDELSFLRRLKPVMCACLLGPLLALAITPDLNIYRNYGAVLSDEFDLESEGYHSLISLFSFLSVLGAVGLLLAEKKVRLMLCLFLLPLLFLAIWVNGKRSMFAYTVVLLGYVFWRKGYLRGNRLVAAAIFAVLLMGVFSYNYQKAIRDISYQSITSDDLYTNVRIDFGRDAQLKMAIYAELYPEVITILEYRGQSLLFYLTMYVPRETWPDKPHPYAVHFTSAMLMSPLRLWGWGMTTSWLDEAMANFSWFGIILGPLVISAICRMGDFCKNNFASALTSIVVSSFLTVQLTAFAPLFFIWLLTVTWIRRRATEQRQRVASRLPLTLSN